MLNQGAWHTLFGLDVSPDASRVLIYSEQLSVRLDYTCRFIFGHVLKLNYQLTSDRVAAEQTEIPVISYSDSGPEKKIWIRPAGLLFETGIREQKPEPVYTDGMVYFYSQEDTGFPYDIFSAVFYFISRYEEWQLFEPDQHQRFEAAASQLFRYGFHLRPVVDHWVMELGAALGKHYPQLKFPEKEFRVMSTIDVDNLYAYKAKGLLRTLGACARDLLKADLVNLKERLLVVSGKKKDPFDIYETVSDFCFEKKIPLIYFFLLRSGTRYDRTVDPRLPAYAKVFKLIKSCHALLGLHPSYHSSVNKALLTEERDLLARRTNEAVNFSRQHYLRFDIRSTPGLLMEHGFEVDFTMGYASAPGFRAGTSHPFRYYDFTTEQSRQLLFVPFCVMDGAYTVYKQGSPEKAFREMLALAEDVKKVKGLFISVFHERSFSDHLYPQFGTLYKNLHSRLKEVTWPEK